MSNADGKQASTVCVRAPQAPSRIDRLTVFTHAQGRILETTQGWSKGETGRQHSAHASEATPAIQGHPLAPAAWHSTMGRSLVLVQCMVQRGECNHWPETMHRLLLVRPHIPGPNRTLNRVSLSIRFRIWGYGKNRRTALSHPYCTVYHLPYLHNSDFCVHTPYMQMNRLVQTPALNPTQIQTKHKHRNKTW